MRHILLIALLLAPGLVVGKPKKRHVAGPYGASSRVVRNAEASGEATLRLRSIDFARRAVVVELSGFARPPAGNLFTFTDERGRRFIATNARCDEPFASGARVCDLTTPDGYERHAWVGLDLHLHGLESHAVVAAPRKEVERAYEAALALSADAPTPASAAPATSAPADDEPADPSESPSSPTR